MLTIVIPSTELFNNETGEFTNTKEQTIRLEHSLISLSKWESKWCKPFLTKTDKTKEETLDYIRCMTITQNVDPSVYGLMTQKQINEIGAYIDAPMTATTFTKSPNEKKSSEVITSEIIYYWMVTFQIPFECQTWHLNRLITLIKVCNIKNQPKGKYNRNEAMRRQRELNAARRAKLNTSG